MATLSKSEDNATSAPCWAQCLPLFLLITVCGYFFAKISSLLLHEWSHSLWADMLGVRSGSIFDICYGHGWIMKGIWAVDGGGFYHNLFETGRGAQAALVAFGGPLANLLLTIISMFLLARKNILKHTATAYLLFWVALHNLAQLWSYTPARTLFHGGGDIYNFCKGLDIPPLLFLIAGTLLLAFAFHWLFTKAMFKIFEPLQIAKRLHLTLFAISWATVFLYYGALPIIYSLQSFTDPSIQLLLLELLIGAVVGLQTLRRYKNLNDYELNPCEK